MLSLLYSKSGDPLTYYLESSGFDHRFVFRYQCGLEWRTKDYAVSMGEELPNEILLRCYTSRGGCGYIGPVRFEKLIGVAGSYLVWAKDPSESCGHYHLIGSNLTLSKAVEIAEERANKDYPDNWERQERNIFRKNLPGSPEADITITSFNDATR